MTKRDDGALCAYLAKTKNYALWLDLVFWDEIGDLVSHKYKLWAELQSTKPTLKFA